jgi:transcriptional regulator with XRE-family HTH domain
MTDVETFGLYLKRLRESRGLSLREAAKAADVSSGYLSQVEAGKRGKRKRGQHFAPHPQILRKLAGAYGVRAQDLFDRAGFLGRDEDSYRGFSEEAELNRCFDFVTRDPMVKDVLSSADKRAIVRRYEAQTGRKLITWSDADSPAATKADFNGLRLSDGVLYANSANPTLTLEEAAQELGLDVADMQRVIDAGYVRPQGKTGLLDKEVVVDFKHYCFREGLRLLTSHDPKQLPKTKEEYLRTDDALHPSGKALEALKRLEERKKRRPRYGWIRTE